MFIRVSAFLLESSSKCLGSRLWLEAVTVEIFTGHVIVCQLTSAPVISELCYGNMRSRGCIIAKKLKA